MNLIQIKSSRVLPEAEDIRLGTTAPIEWGLKFFQGGKLDTIKRHIVFERR